MTLTVARRGRVVFRHLTPGESHFPASRLPFAHGNARLLAIATRNVSPVASGPYLLNGPLPIILKNSYASSVGRPKAHMGKAPASKKPASGIPKAKANAKGTKKAKKPKAAKLKRKTKAKPKPKSKSKRLTEKQKETLKKKKEREEITALKAAALTPPKPLPISAYALFIQEKNAFGPETIEAYKNLTTTERERLDQLAAANRASNVASFTSWVNSHTPLQIKAANEARKKLRRKFKDKKRQFPIIQDSRQVKRAKTAFMIFVEQLNSSGEFENLKVTERGAEAGQRWKGLTQGEKEAYERMGNEDAQRYHQEYTTVYGEPPKRPRASTPRSSSSPI